jgi:hypothetical protein
VLEDDAIRTYTAAGLTTSEPYPDDDRIAVLRCTLSDRSLVRSVKRRWPFSGAARDDARAQSGQVVSSRGLTRKPVIIHAIADGVETRRVGVWRIPGPLRGRPCAWHAAPTLSAASSPARSPEP